MDSGSASVLSHEDEQKRTQRPRRAWEGALMNVPRVTPSWNGVKLTRPGRKFRQNAIGDELARCCLVCRDTDDTCWSLPGLPHFPQV